MIFKSKSAVEQRDRIIAFKRTFATDEGKTVLRYLMNRFHILNAHDGHPRQEGERKVVLEIMHQCNIDIEEFDKLLKGDDSDTSGR